MARKQSRRARIAPLIVVAAAAFAALRALAETKLEVTAPANIVENPFAVMRPQAKVAAEEPQISARKSTPYQNPFSNMSKAPPIEPSLKPGPVSRWQRPQIPHDEPSAIKSAMLLPPVTAKVPTWDQLPPADCLRQQAFAQKRGATDPTFFNNLANTDSIIRFTPQPLGQPASITAADLSAASPVATPASFHEPANAISIVNGSATVPTLPQPATSQTGRIASAFDIQTTAATEPFESDDDFEPTIITDIVDTPEEWLRQAQEAAAGAESDEELSLVVELCDRGIRGIPAADMLSRLRRLSAWAHNRRGELLADAQRSDDAFQDFQAAISMDPACSLAIHNRAVSLAQRNQFAAALRDFDRVIELNPGLAVAYRNRAELLAALGRMKEAVADYSRAMESLPEDATLLCARAHAYQRLGEFQHAAADLSRAIQLAPQEPDAYTQRGNLAAEQGAFHQARRDFQWAVEIDANWADAHRALAWLHATCTDPKIRNAQQALASARRAAELLPKDDYLILDTLAAAHACAGDFDEAVQCEGKALAAAPRDVSTALEQRMALYRQGRAYLSRPADDGVRTVSHESPDPPQPSGSRPSPKSAPR
jgi:tetratricopeptide (TPR) repeat protein